ncbi:hypothetical protein L1987_21420 [Smallanthus sonchifolius]|uniref:Uncharacterized protein n=1 Tax=Smallanthus sonchifolius TaxID=185202 RepID=A0ACB9IXE8_9ASTR|nr:hypothetical protein L1987_21420 [Smallanthus sonchifolius]
MARDVLTVQASTVASEYALQDQTSLEDKIQAEEIIHNNEVDLGISEPVTDKELAEDARLRSSSFEDKPQE